MTTDSKPVKANPQLGNYRRAYTPSKKPNKAFFVSIFFLVLMAVMQFISALKTFFSMMNTVPINYHRTESIVVSIILGVVFLVFIFIMGAIYYSHQKLCVVLYEKGFIVSTWRGTTSFLWDEVADFEAIPVYTKRGTTPISWQYKIVHKDGTKAHLRGLDDLRSLSELIESKIS